MIRGMLESLSAQGVFEGWAFDADQPERPSLIEVRCSDGASLAIGYANLYREDLARAGRGVGWCAFRLRATQPAARLRDTPLELIDKRSDRPIHRLEALPYADDRETDLGVDEDAARLDPFVVARLAQLQGCADLFQAFIRARGLNAFVRVAYIYVLGRPADPEGAAIYGKMIEQRSLTPFELLELLADSGEHQSNPRALAAPNSTGFPFFVDRNAG